MTIESGLIAILTLLLTIVGWFLRDKDSKQAKEIAILFMKYDALKEEVASLKLGLAKDHYVKRELDDRFSHLERAINTAFEKLGTKFDHLSSVLIAHVAKEDGWSKELQDTMNNRG